MTLKNVKYSETIGHLLIKKFFYDNIPLVNDVKLIDQEIKVGNRVADVYIELKNGKKVIIEIQHSKISKASLIQRTREYNQEGFHVLWVLDGEGPYDRTPKNRDVVFISSSEIELQSLYKGRVYYINAAEDGIKAPVYALHFSAYFQKKISTNGIKYYKKSKNKNSTILGKIPSLKLTLFRYKGFKLARFLDENIRIKCTSEVLQFLDNIAAYRIIKPVKAKKNFPDGLLLGTLIRKFVNQYGLYLLFDVLKHLKILRIKDARYMFNEELWFRKCILP